MSEQRITKTSKREVKKKQIPAGAKILDTENSIEVEEIENGFIITKTTRTKYSTGPKEYDYDWTHDTKKYYSETDPLTINTDDKELAEVFAE